MGIGREMIRSRLTRPFLPHAFIQKGGDSSCASFRKLLLRCAALAQCSRSMKGPTAIAMEAGERAPPKVAAVPRGQTALHGAASHGHVEVVRVLLQHGADPRARASKRRNGGGVSSAKEKSWPAIEEAPPRPETKMAGEPKEREA